jgi:hypothetical protein
MEVEAGMNMENTIIVLQAYWKMLSIWWPIVVIGIVGIIITDMKVDKMKENKKW